MKGRLLPRFSNYVADNITILSALCYFGGVVAVLLLPLFAKSTYISENSLMPGSANPYYGHVDAVDAVNTANEIRRLISQEGTDSLAVQRWLLRQMVAVGADCYLHPVPPPPPAFQSVSFLLPSLIKGWSSPDLSDNHYQQYDKALSVVGIIRAPQGEGNEALMLVTPFERGNFSEGDALTLGLGLTLFRVLSKALWLARDIIWLVADGQYGVVNWLEEYHQPNVHHLETDEKCNSDRLKQLLLEEAYSYWDNSDDLSLGDFKRAGTIATGIVFDLHTGFKGGDDVISLLAEGPNGQMPNLDLINVVNSIAVWREGLRIKLEEITLLKDLINLKFMNHVLQKIAKLLTSTNLTQGFTSHVNAYANGLVTLLSCITFQVLGLPTGAHGAFRHYQIDSLSLHMPLTAEMNAVFVVTKYGRLLEGLVRSVNNLLEKFHQSFFLYYLSAPNKYISVGIYMIPFSLLLISLPLFALTLSVQVKRETQKIAEELLVNQASVDLKQSSSNIANSSSKLKWIQATVLVTVMQLWAFYVAIIPPLISQMGITDERKLLVWLALAIGGLVISQIVLQILCACFQAKFHFVSGAAPLDWIVIKTVTLGVTTIGLGVMSAIDYAVALVGALFLVPICLSARPLKKSVVKASHRTLSLLVSSVVMLLTIIAFPPVMLMLAKFAFGKTLYTCPGNVWLWLESLLYWRSALYYFVLLIQLPCSVLCLHIIIFCGTH